MRIRGKTSLLIYRTFDSPHKTFRSTFENFKHLDLGSQDHPSSLRDMNIEKFLSLPKCETKPSTPPRITGSGTEATFWVG
jgi:hypothetical protein